MLEKQHHQFSVNPFQDIYLIGKYLVYIICFVPCDDLSICGNPSNKEE